MKVKELVDKLDLKVESGSDFLENEVLSGFSGDLLSVVMGKAEAGCAWITIQSHFNIVAVATLVDVACVIVTEGFEVEAGAIEKAQEENVPVLTTKMSSYQVAAKMALLGIE